MSEAFHIIPGDPAVPMFIFGDHASRFIAPRYADLGLSGEDLTRHIAWDIGTEAVVRGLCARFGAGGVVAGFSRLVIDANRPETMESLIPEFSDGTDIPGNLNLDADAREERIATLHRPYHAQLRRAISAYQNRPLCVSIHSFTPHPHTGDPRHLDIGLLVKDDIPTATIFEHHLAALSPQLSIGVNEPYSAHDLNHTVDTHLSPRNLPHLAIEIRQDHLGDDAGIAAMVKIIAITNRRTAHMRRDFIPEDFDHTFIARQHAIGGHGKGFECRLSTQPGKDMRCSSAFMIATLRADMVEPGAIGYLDFHHLVEPRRGRAIFQNRQFSPCIKLDAMVQYRIGSL